MVSVLVFGLCGWARHLTLTEPLSSQVYKLVLANLMLGVILQCASILSREKSRNTPSCFMLQTIYQDKLWPDGPVGLYADFFFYLNSSIPTHITFCIEGYVLQSETC